MLMEMSRIESYIGKVYWKEAKTYKDTAPHEYTIREWRPELETDFLEFVGHIREFGVPERYFSKTFIYFYLGDHKYWTMGAPVHETIVLNRCIHSDYPDNIYKGN